MRSKNPYALISVAVAATAFGSTAFAGGEAGQLVLRDLGAKYVGYTTKQRGQGLAQRAERDVRAVHAAGATASTSTRSS